MRRDDDGRLAFAGRDAQFRAPRPHVIGFVVLAFELGLVVLARLRVGRDADQRQRSNRGLHVGASLCVGVALQSAAPQGDAVRSGAMRGVAERSAERTVGSPAVPCANTRDSRSVALRGVAARSGAARCGAARCGAARSVERRRRQSVPRLSRVRTRGTVGALRCVEPRRAAARCDAARRVMPSASKAGQSPPWMQTARCVALR